MMTWGNSLSQRTILKLGSLLHMMTVKWFFHVQILHSAVLRRCEWAGVSWKSTVSF